MWNARCRCCVCDRPRSVKDNGTSIAGTKAWSALPSAIYAGVQYDKANNYVYIVKSHGTFPSSFTSQASVVILRVRLRPSARPYRINDCESHSYNAADGRDHCRGAIRQRRLADLQASSAERRRAGPVRQPLRHRLAAGLDLLCRPLVQDRLALLPGPGLPTDRPTRRHQRSRVLCVRTMLDSNRDSLLVA